MTTDSLLAVDWGTSSLRGAVLSRGGRVTDSRSFPRGVLTVATGEFPAVFDSCFGDLMPPGRLCLIAGMAGSRQGWVEAPYRPCPASFDELAGSLVWVEPGRIAIVPGLSCEDTGLPDVMRGEETQVVGALDLLQRTDARLVLPGTHSKWVEVAHGRIAGFSTWMTGEFYSLLRHHSILARTLPEADGRLDGEAFERAVRHALAGAALLHSAFGVRTLSLMERMPAESLPSYLSGLVIGEELRAQQLAAGSDVILIGAEGLALRYERALALMNVTCRKIGDEATWHGLWRLAQFLKPI